MSENFWLLIFYCFPLSSYKVSNISFSIQANYTVFVGNGPYFNDIMDKKRIFAIKLEVNSVKKIITANKNS